MNIKKVNIDVNNFQTGEVIQPLLELFKSMENNFKFLRELLPDNSLIITYENDVLKNPKHAYKKVCDFLSLKDENVKVEYKRTNPFPLKELIINYEEISELLKGTKYDWMLKEV